MRFLFFLFIFLFLLSTEAKEESFLRKNNKIKGKTKELEVKSLLKSGKLSEKREKDKNKACSASGQELIYSHNFSSTALNISSGIEEWFQKSLPYIKKEPSLRCPKQCRQSNSYQVISKIYPKTVKKGSCKGKEAKESYSFEKKFLSLKKNIEKTHEDMLEWILGTFVYPFVSILSMDSSSEAIKSNISAACPSCSFYLDYSYKYIEGKGLDLVIKAQCGDIRRLISRFKFEFALMNNWRCEEGP